MADWHAGDVRFLTMTQLGERYRRYRLPDPDAEAAMTGSFRRYGQLTPLVVCLREETYEVLDGFKRLVAARTLGLSTVARDCSRPTSVRPRPPSSGSTRPAGAPGSGKKPGSFMPWSARTA